MRKKFIIVMLVDEKSANEEIILKSLNYLKKIKNKILFTGDIKKFKKLKSKIFFSNIINKEILKKKIFFYHIPSNNLSNFKYLKKLTTVNIKLLENKVAKILINMPLSKRRFLENKFLGFTEFFARNLNQTGMENMLLFNERFSVTPITTHLKLSEVSKSINSKKLMKTAVNVYNFYKKILKKKIHIKVLGLNPHAGIDYKFPTEEKVFIKKSIKKIKNKIKNIEGPISADTAFSKINNTNFIGMYHDQVLPVFKTLVGFEGINISIGLKHIRISPDHGTALDLLKKNKRKINNKSFIYCIKFCEKYF